MSLLSFVARVAIAITYLVAVAARADAPAPGDLPSAGLSDMQAGRMLIRAGRLEHAHAFLEQARPADGHEWIERLFLLGQIEMRLGLPRRAAERFETILARRPGMLRVRLELARAYFLSGRDEKAKFHFSASLAEGLPSSVEDAVERFMRSIDARKRWSVSFSASLLPEVRRPDRETILIGGIPFRVSEDARASSGSGSLVSAGGSFSPKLTDDVRGVLAVSGAAKRYVNSDWNDTTASGDIGVSRLFDAGSVSGGLRLGRRWSAGERFHTSLGPWMHARWRFSDSTEIGVALHSVYLAHDERSDRDGWRIVATPRLLHILDSRTSIELEPAFEWVEAEATHHGSHLAGIGATVSRAFDGGLSVSVTASSHVRSHSDRDPLFGDRRIDRNLRLSAQVLHRSLRYRGFAPYFGVSLDRNRSNIPIHESRSHGVFAGVSRRF